NGGGVTRAKRKLPVKAEERRSVSLRVVEDSETASNHRVLEDAKSESKPWRPIVPIVLNADLTVRIDAGKEQFPRGQIQRCPLIVHLDGRWSVFVTQPDVQRETAVHLPVVLDK